MFRSIFLIPLLFVSSVIIFSACQSSALDWRGSARVPVSRTIPSSKPLIQTLSLENDLAAIPISTISDPELDAWALDQAFHYHAGLTGEYTRDAEQLRAFYPWAGAPFGGYKLIEGVGPGAERNMMIERPLRSPWLVDALEGRDLVTPDGARFAPVAGVQDGVERYVLHFGLDDHPSPEEKAWYVEQWHRKAPMYPQGHDLPYQPSQKYGFTYHWRAPKDPEIAALLQFRSHMVMKTMQMLTWRHAYKSSMPVLRQNPLFWTNPYTDQPMKAVPMSAPTPGDYSIIGTPGSVAAVIFHYVDYENEVSSIVF